MILSSVWNLNFNKSPRPLSKYLLLAECEARTASYGPSFFLPFMAKREACAFSMHQLSIKHIIALIQVYKMETRLCILSGSSRL